MCQEAETAAVAVNALLKRQAEEPENKQDQKPESKTRHGTVCGRQ